jgi:hypothetical protein
MNNRRLFEIYRGAELPDATAALAGQNAGSQRGVLLATLVNQGKLKAQNLSPRDASLAGADMDKVPHPGESQLGNVLGGALGFTSHLGSDIWSFSKGLPSGLVTAGKAIVHDINPVGDLRDSQVIEKLVKPTGQYYKQQYGEGNVFKNFYEHPLGPILDVATVASGGAAGVGRVGSSLSRAGKISPESRLATMASTRGRSPLILDKTLDEGLQSPTIDRTYSARPLRKGLQVLTDKAGERTPAVQKGQIWSSRNLSLKKGSSIKDSEALQQINRQVRQLIPVLKDLTPNEETAFDLVVRGANSPQWIDRLEEARAKSTAGELPEGANVGDYGKRVDPAVAASRQTYSPEVRDLASNPSQSDRLMNALHSYYNIVEERIGRDLDPDVFSEKANELRNALGEVTDKPHITAAQAARGVTSDHPFPEPTIAPAQVAKNFEWHEPSRLGQIFGKEAGFKKVQGPFTPSNVTYQNVLQEPYNTFRPNPNPLLAGVYRPDLRQFTDLVAKHERDVIEQGYSARVINHYALKDDKGEPVKVKTPQEAEKYGPQYTAVHPSAPLHYYSDQTTVGDMIAFMDQNGFPVDGPEMRAAVEALGEDTAVKMTQAAKRQEAYVLPKSVVEYQRKIENAAKPYDNPAMRMAAKYLNYWRTYTLSLMPRWALNTAVGSFMLNTVKGVGPRDYIMASRINKDIGTAPNIFEEPEAGGVNLGNQIGMELLEPAMQGGVNKTNAVARFGMQKVQGIEDYFRRASFVHSLSRESKQHMREVGATIKDFESTRGPRSVDEYRDTILNNPDLVERALDDVNRFAYNFAMLGPVERRYVRQIAPFWGWYKFISGVAYKLPVDYPGRTAIMNRLSVIGLNENEDKYGEMPSWMMGNIPLSASGGMMKYLSTTGLNPLSQVFNPASPEGIAGVAQLGQASPLIQAALAAYGVDSMSGGTLPVSPEHGVSPDFTGTLRDELTGEERNVGSVAPGARILGTLIRSFPEARIGERIRSGGRSVYPESVPLLYEHYMGTKPESRFGSGTMEALQQMTGTAVRPFNLQSYQSFRRKGQRYAKRKGTRARARLKRNLEK